MKIFKVMMVALAAILGLSSCDKHEWDDHSADLVGTWTYIGPGYAEALVISADGSVVSTGCDSEDYWENVNGKIVVEDGKVTMTFDDDDNFEGHFDIIPGVAFSIYTEEGERMVYNYCKEDLSEEVVGMWVYSNRSADETMAIQTFSKDGSVVRTGYSEAANGYVLNNESSYKVVGDLLIVKLPEEFVGGGYTPSMGMKLTYAPNGTALGDILTIHEYMPEANGVVQTKSWLRVKQDLNLAGEEYDYSKVFVSNVKGDDQEVDFMGFEFNFAKMDGVILDKMLKTILFNIEFPDAKTIRYSCHYNSISAAKVEAPIKVEGNKMTIKVSEIYPAFADVDFYTFQDADGCQLHMYMPTYSFVNFFANMQMLFMAQLGQLDPTDAAAVKAVYDSVNAAVESINVSFVMESTTKSL